VLHRAVVIGGEHEADADFIDAAADLLRRQVDIDAERFENVGAARLRGDRASAMLGDAGPGRGGDEHRRRRDVEGLRAVAAGAAGVDQVRAVADRTLVDNSRMTCAAAEISPIVSFLTRRPMMIAAIMTGVTSPPMIWRIRETISS
jgi:hypothetical protein